MYKSELNIPDNHSLVQNQDSEWKQKKGQDTDTYFLNELDVNEKVINKYIIKDSTSMYPPFKRTISFDKYSIDDVLIESDINVKI